MKKKKKFCGDFPCTPYNFFASGSQARNLRTFPQGHQISRKVFTKNLCNELKIRSICLRSLRRELCRKKKIGSLDVYAWKVKRGSVFGQLENSALDLFSSPSPAWRSWRLGHGVAMSDNQEPQKGENGFCQSMPYEEKGIAQSSQSLWTSEEASGFLGKFRHRRGVKVPSVVHLEKSFHIGVIVDTRGKPSRILRFVESLTFSLPVESAPTRLKCDSASSPRMQVVGDR